MPSASIVLSRDCMNKSILDCMYFSGFSRIMNLKRAKVSLQHLTIMLDQLTDPLLIFE